MSTRMNFSSLRQVAYPARWRAPKYHFGQQVLYLDATTVTITGMRWCVAWPGDERTPALYEWHYELDGVIWVPAEVLSVVPMEVLQCA